MSTNIAISLDGKSARSHDLVRGKGAFDLTLQGIRKLVNAELPVHLNTIVHRGNAHELLHMYDFVKKIGVRTWRLGLPRLEGRYEKNVSLLAVDPELVFEMYYRLLEKYLTDSAVSQRGDSKLFELQIEFLFRMDALSRFAQRFSPESYCCDYQLNSCCIKPNGDVVPCSYLSDIVIGNVRERKLESIWYSKEMQAIKQIKVRDTGCFNCSNMQFCGGGCRAQAFFNTGSLYAKDEVSCKHSAVFRSRIIPLLARHLIEWSEDLGPTKL